MDKDALLSIIEDFKTCLNAETLAQIQEVRDSYPYCGLLQELFLLNKKNDSDDWTVNLPLTALYSTDRQFLREKLEKTSHPQKTDLQQENDLIIVIKESDNQEKKENEEGKDEISLENIDVLFEIDSYEEVSLKTAPKQVLIEKFLEIQSPKINKPKEHHESNISEQQNESKNAGFVSETLALLHEKRGDITKAIQMYEQLSLKYPEKSYTFATQIERLKGLINNSN